jgi:hypothetical protein
MNWREFGRLALLVLACKLVLLATYYWDAQRDAPPFMVQHRGSWVCVVHPPVAVGECNQLLV